MAPTPGTSARDQLTFLLQQAEPRAARPERHLWLIALVQWLRAGPQPVLDGGPAPALQPGLPAAVWRLQAVLDALDADPGRRRAVAAVLQRFVLDNDATSLLADFGFTSRPAFWSEFAERLRTKIMPATPDTGDLASLFGLLFNSADDADWLMALPDAQLARVVALFTTPAVPVDADDVAGAAPPVDDIAAHWRAEIAEAITFSVSHVRSAAFSPLLRRRMRATGDVVQDVVTPFRQLASAWEATQRHLHPGERTAGAADEVTPLTQELTYFRALLDACMQAVRTVPEHLEDNGVSVSIVFDAWQLERRIARIEILLDCLVGRENGREHLRMLADFARIVQGRRSIVALVARNTSLLSRKIAERHAETGEHYITHTGREYAGMLWAAAGGGAVMGLTTWFKIGIIGLHMPSMLTGLWVGLNYAATFVLIALLHWTIATKQPAMTAPAMADKLADLSDRRAAQAFVDEVAALTRSQAAGVFGNVALVFPAALALGLAAQWLFGAPLLDAAHARAELASLSLLGPTPLFAVFTGVLLFASSVVAGWTENAFVLHRLDSALRWNPRIRAVLGAERAARWAIWWRANVSSMAGNISLGFLFGLVPELLAGFGLGLQVRHVTLSTGLMGAATATLGWGVLHESAFWWAVPGVIANGLLNVVTSFYLAFRLALRARGIGLQDRRLLRTALRSRLRRNLLSFVWPPRAAAAQAGDAP